MQGLLEEAYDQIENDYITKIQNQMSTYQRWYVAHTSASKLFFDFFVNSFMKALSFLGQEVSVTVGAGGDKVCVFV